MPSLTPKIIDGNTYYYARYCQRVDGKPKIVRQVYLGKIEDLVAATEASRQPPQPLETEVAAFADVAALFDIAQRLELVPLLNSILPRKRHQGLSVGQYLLLAAINRAVAPTSKLQFADWYQQTALTRLLPADPAWLSSQHFWNHMDLVDSEHILEFEKQMAQRLVQRFQLDLRALVYDGTNFFTYINTNTPAELPQRGRNKQKRGDLRQVSLGLLVSADFHIPLFHQVYAGNVNDSTEFRSVVAELATHYRQLAQACEHITLIFDKGNNSAAGFQQLQATPFHFVGSLVPSQHADLLAILRRRFHPLTHSGLEQVEVYRTQKKVFGATRTIVVTFNPNLLAGQLQGLNFHLTKARYKLRQLQIHLQHRREGSVKGGKAPTLESVQRQIRSFCSAQFVGKILKAEVHSVPNGLELTFHTDAAALDRLTRLQFGKTILFSDHADWTEEQIVLAYRSQYHIEDAFKQMKDPHFLRWSPLLHWTDSKIQVHAFYCVLALLLTSLLQRELARQGESLSLNSLLQQLAGIRETLVIYPRRQGQHQNPTASCLTRRSPLQQRLFALLELHRYAPTTA
ncbi:MAG TPA: IS1634 family transposase [Terriglobales bacterium]|nr:IS1634 family transposase [Terriglobales bacterium]